MSEAMSESPSRPPIVAGRRYCLITPCRNEAKFVRQTLETVTGQSVPPSAWVIVDDGSTDETPDIVREFAKRFDYIQLIHRADRGKRAVGPGVIEAFYDGLATVNLDDFDYVCKLDADLELPLRYFERLMEEFDREPLLGNLSGKLFERRPDGSLFEERTGDENAVGPTKFYRVSCFRDIGGFVREVAWDGIDGHVCRMRGWFARSMTDPELQVIHLRPMGSSQQNIYVGRVRWGRGKYFMGSAWYYTLAAAAYRSLEPPWIAAGACISFGYFRALVSGHHRYDNPAYQRFLRRYELSSLVLGKRRTLDRFERRIRDQASSTP
jgi:glycosyltransferase involved in cell wall biosynthesis